MKTAIVLLLLSVSHLSIAEDNLFYVGTWQSNEKMTLASMNKIKDIPEKTREAYSDHFYGRLVNIIRKDSFTTYFVDQKPEEFNFVDAEIKVLPKNTIRLKYFHETRDKYVEREISFENNCYSVPDLQWGFREYFCRVE